MKQLTILMILLAVFITAEQSFGQSKKKRKVIQKTQLDEWNMASNGVKLTVKWTLRVGGINQDGFGVWCTLCSKADPYDLKHKVNLFGIDIKRSLHTGDYIIAKGETMGVDNMDGKVRLLASGILNNGDEPFPDMKNE